jgi:lipoprotein-releasing system permease protein
MNPVFAAIALRHLYARRRQSLVSLLGIVLGVAFFLAIAALMQGSESDFIKRLIDNLPHITVYSEYRSPKPQPAAMAYPGAAVEIRNVLPQNEVRGIRGYDRILDMIRTIPGLRASPVLNGNGVTSIAGKNVAIVLNGMIPREIKDVSTIGNYMKEGKVDDLEANFDGIIIGAELARTMSLGMHRTITVAAANGQVHTFKIVGIFRTGRADYDQSQTFANLKRVQSLFDRPNRANTIIIKVADPYQARAMASRIEADIGYKSVSWQEATEDLMSTLTIRNIIMYTVVSAVLVVAAFGIYNVISTVVLEKRRDIAIMKSMGFHAGDIQNVFVVEGLILGLGGSVFGLLLGAVFMYGLGRIELRVPGATEPIAMPIDWGWYQFVIAAAFAIGAALIAALLPARKGARVNPAEILRGS